MPWSPKLDRILPGLDDRASEPEFASRSDFAFGGLNNDIFVLDKLSRVGLRDDGEMPRSPKLDRILPALDDRASELEFANRSDFAAFGGLLNSTIFFVSLILVLVGLSRIGLGDGERLWSLVLDPVESGLGDLDNRGLLYLVFSRTALRRVGLGDFGRETLLRGGLDIFLAFAVSCAVVGRGVDLEVLRPSLTFRGSVGVLACRSDGLAAIDDFFNPDDGLSRPFFGLGVFVAPLFFFFGPATEK